MKPFNYEDARQGAPICDAKGFPARIICHDLEDYADYRLVVLVSSESGKEYISTNRTDGSGIVPLYMATRKVTRYTHLREDRSIGHPLFFRPEQVQTNGPIVTVTWEE